MIKKITIWSFGIILSIAVLLAGIVGFFYFSACNYQVMGVPVLNYHQVNDKFNTALTMTTAHFDEQMAYLEENGYHSITQEQFTAYLKGDGDLPDKPVLITFDDGYIDNYDCAYPIMKKHGMRGTIFIILNFLDQPHYLTTPQIQAMSQDGMEFGSHTISHKRLSEMDEATVHKELTESKRILEQKLGKPITYLAYPEGKYNAMVKRETAACGYDTGFTVNTGRDFPWDDHYDLDRVPFFEGPGSFMHFKFRLVFSSFAALLWKTHDYLEHTEGLKQYARHIPQP